MMPERLRLKSHADHKREGIAKTGKTIGLLERILHEPPSFEGGESSLEIIWG